ncbi:thioredoxin domain-containing protein [Pseudomonas akapageensis]|uniref:thioredoxin domain-containing protein n=1 Tax=Pseudomonas akapageensis TaxID=2609961 RepID=UPI0014073551|nr:thioredoxin domain-containing protein [Pseudomonas akapageensis]
MTVLVVNDENFNDEVLNSVTPVVVEFTKPGTKADGTLNWSGKASEYVDAWAKTEARVKFVRMGYAANPVTAGKYKIESAPILVYFKAGDKVTEVVGFFSDDVDGSGVILKESWYKQKLEELFQPVLTR